MMPQQHAMKTQQADPLSMATMEPVPSRAPKPKRVRRRPSVLKSFGTFWKKQNHENGSVASLVDKENVSPDEHVRPVSAQASVPQSLCRMDSEKRDEFPDTRPAVDEKRFSGIERRRRISLPCAESGSHLHAIDHASCTSLTSVSSQPAYRGRSASITSRRSRAQMALRKYWSSTSTKPWPDAKPQLGMRGPARRDSKQSYCSPCSSAESIGPERSWLLNLVMQSREDSNREKFFITYLESPTKWRRLTVSVDCRDPSPGSLEAELCATQLQQDKSLRIHEALRESLLEVRFHENVTNLRLETTPGDGQLHVHVREDKVESIEFPQLSLLEGVGCEVVSETQLHFVSHLGAFLYLVRVGNLLQIKKEISGAHSVDEFVYEVNALHAVHESDRVVRLGGLVVDESGSYVKGLLLPLASLNTLEDITRGNPAGTNLPWFRREKWAKQIIQSVADLHEAGIVHGGPRLASFVVDEDDNVTMVELNRQGRHFSRSPPELEAIKDCATQVKLRINPKTDLYQLGMVLWSLAESSGERESDDRSPPQLGALVPTYYRRIVETCLSGRPQDRVSAVDLLSQFPQHHVVEGMCDRSDSLEGPQIDFSSFNMDIPQDFRPDPGYFPCHRIPDLETDTWEHNVPRIRTAASTRQHKGPTSPQSLSSISSASMDGNFLFPPTLDLGADGELLTAVSTPQEEVEALGGLLAEPVAIAARGKAHHVRITTSRPASQGGSIMQNPDTGPKPTHKGVRPVSLPCSPFNGRFREGMDGGDSSAIDEALGSQFTAKRPIDAVVAGLRRASLA